MQRTVITAVMGMTALGALDSVRASETFPDPLALLGPSLENGAAAPSGTSLLGGELLAQRVLDEDEKKPAPDPDEPQEFEAQPEKTPSLKSPLLAMGLSAVLPGAGQYYVDKGNLLAFVFAGIEVTAWYLHFAWEQDGDELTEEFERFAWKGVVDPENGAPRNDIQAEAGHWSWERWRDSFNESEGCLHPGNINYLETDSMLVNFWFTNRREFYEDIGKYDKYDCGWLNSEFRTQYRSMRDEANSVLERSRQMTQIVLLNHLVSSVQAYFMAKSHNKHVREALSMIDWQVRPEHGGGMRAQLALRQHF